MVDWSYDLLAAPERELFQRLSVFVGGFELEAAEAVSATAGIEAFDVADLLGSLVNKSLVTAERSSTSLRYRLLETMRQYSADLLDRSVGEDRLRTARQLHAGYYLQLAEEAAPELVGPAQARWFKRLDLEWDNLQAAFHTLAGDSERTEELIRLGVALPSFLATRLHQGPILLLRQALERGDPIPVRLMARARLSLGVLIGMTQSGERPYETARRLCEEAVELARQLTEPSVEAEALVRLARTSWYLGQPEKGHAQALSALEIAQQVGDHGLIGRALATAGFVQPISPARRESYQAALVHLRQAGDLSSVCSGLIGLSIGDWGSLAEVLESPALQEEAIAIAEELGSLYHLLVLWTNCGVACYLLGELEAAQRYSSRALRLNRRRGRSAADSIWTVFALSCCATSEGDFVLAAQLVGAHDAISQALDETDDSNWSPLETEMRETNRARLVEALGEEAFDRARAAGAGLAFGRVVDVALGRG